MKLLKNTSLALLSTLIMSTQSAVAEVLTDTQLHATLGVITHFILDDNIIVHHGIRYETVTSPYTGKVWLDRNLGATQVCTNIDDTSCFGDYYQWGRGVDGHQNSTSNTTNTQSTDINNVGHGDFIAVSFNWASVDANGSARSTNWSKIDATSVCPSGFRVPTDVEVRAELFDIGSAEITNSTEAFDSFLKLPSNGYRNGATGTMFIFGLSGTIWTSVASSTFHGTNIYFDSDLVGYSLVGRSDGRAVRCLRD